MAIDGTVEGVGGWGKRRERGMGVGRGCCGSLRVILVFWIC